MGSRMTLFACVICTALALAPMFAEAQGGGQQAISLGDLAREQRRKEGKDSKKPAKAFTNEDFPAHPPDALPTSAHAAPSAAETEKLTGHTDPNSTASSSRAHDEEYYRSEMKRLRTKLKEDQALLARLQGELVAHNKDVPLGAGASVSLTENPRWTTNPVGTYYAWAAEDKWLRSRIESWQTKIAIDEKAISHLVEQCRHEDCLPEWIQ